MYIRLEASGGTSTRDRCNCGCTTWNIQSLRVGMKRVRIVTSDRTIIFEYNQRRFDNETALASLDLDTEEIDIINWYFSSIRIVSTNNNFHLIKFFFSMINNNTFYVDTYQYSVLKINNIKITTIISMKL